MGGGHELARNLREQEPGQDSRHAKAAGTLNIAQGAGRAKRAGLYHITPEGGEPFTIEATGREAWALDRLREAGPRGCTPITQPAPRWAAYVHSLRGLGVPIETLSEPHGGEIAGHHARYGAERRCGMKALRIARLRARYGLTASQAALLAALAWGGGE